MVIKYWKICVGSASKKQKFQQEFIEYFFTPIDIIFFKIPCQQHGNMNTLTCTFHKKTYAALCSILRDIRRD